MFIALYNLFCKKEAPRTEPELVNQTFEQGPSSLSKGKHPTWCTQMEYGILCARRDIEVFRSMGYKVEYEG